MTELYSGVTSVEQALSNHFGRIDPGLKKAARESVFLQDRFLPYDDYDSLHGVQVWGVAD